MNASSPNRGLQGLKPRFCLCRYRGSSSSHLLKRGCGVQRWRLGALCATLARESQIEIGRGGAG
jgi:hypothetical protein